MALFDYLSLLCKYIFYTESEEDCKWIDLHNFALKGTLEKNRMGNTHISISNLKDAVAIHHKEFVRILWEYRSDIIHRKNDVAPKDFWYDLFDPTKKIFAVLAPKDFSKKFKDFSPKSNSIQESAFYIVEQTMIRGNDVLMNLRKDISIINKSNIV
jgi:hypothetical protein